MRRNVFFYSRLFPAYAGLAFIFLTGFTFNPFHEIEELLLEKKYSDMEAAAQRLTQTEQDVFIQNKARYYLGIGFLNQGKYPQAQEIFESLSDQSLSDDLSDKIILGLFDAYYLQEDYERAAKIVRGMIKNREESDYLSMAYLRFAKANLKLSKWRTAREYLEKIIKLFPYSLEVPTARQLLEEKQFFAVQVGSFRDRRLAEQLIAELKQKGEYAYMVQTQSNDGQIFYRVRVGQLSNLHDVRILKGRLSEQGYPTRIYP